MKDIIFNPVDSKYKAPIGSITNTDEIVIKINITKTYSISDLKIVIHKDHSNDYFCFPLSYIYSDEDYNVYECRFKINEIGLYWYNFEFYDCYGKHFISCDDSLDAFLCDDFPRCWQLGINKEFKGKLSWYKGKTMYQIFPDRFFDGGISYKKDYAIIHDNWNDIPNYKSVDGVVLNNDFFGGDLKGIIKKLDYLENLNIGVIYLNPIFLSYSNHKYDTADYLSIDPMFGSIDDFEVLCSEAKKRNIRIILDGVFNHTGDDSIYFNKYNNFNSVGAFQSKQSKYYNWYKFNSWPNSYLSWWNFPTLPSINQKDESYLEFITGKNGVINKWLDLGASGWRIDVIDELDNEFVDRIYQAIKDNDEENILLGEVWEDASNKIAYNKRRNYLNGSQVDSVMNYPFRTAIIDYIVNNNYKGLRNQIRKIINNYPKHVLDSVMNPLSTHDTIRAITSFSSVNINYLSKDEQAGYKMSKEDYYSARQKLKMASAIQFTLPGVPSIFYGDEAGVEGFKDPFCRKTMPWDSFDEVIYQWYKLLTKIRLDEVYVDGVYLEEICEGGVFAFSRINKDYKIMTVVNNSHYDYSYHFENAFDMINEENIKNVIIIPSESVAILKVNCENE